MCHYHRFLLKVQEILFFFAGVDAVVLAEACIPKIVVVLLCQSCIVYPSISKTLKNSLDKHFLADANSCNSITPETSTDLSNIHSHPSSPKWLCICLQFKVPLLYSSSDTLIVPVCLIVCVCVCVCVCVRGC